MLADILADVNGRAFPLVKVVDVSQLPIALRAERSDGFTWRSRAHGVGLEYSVDVRASGVASR